jgi:Cytochrome b5-like Heme/Steroid binding domain
MFTSARMIKRLNPSRSLRMLSKGGRENARVSSVKAHDFPHAAVILFGISVCTVHQVTKLENNKKMADSSSHHIQDSCQQCENLNQPPPRPDLPTISLEEVAEHCDESSLWYTFRGAVYDMTFFLHGHPGGEPVSLKLKAV